MKIKHFLLKNKTLIFSCLSCLLTILLLLSFLQNRTDITPSAPTASPINTCPPQINKPVYVSVAKQPQILFIDPLPSPSIKPRYGFTDDDIYLMATLLSGSKDVDGDGEFDIDYGRDDEYDQISLVFSVVMNRVRSTDWPNTVSEVIWQKGQFTPMKRWVKKLPEVSDISLQRTKEWTEAYDTYDPGVQSVPENHVYFTGDGKYNYSR